MDEPQAQNLHLLWGPSSSLCLGGGQDASQLWTDGLCLQWRRLSTTQPQGPSAGWLRHPGCVTHSGLVSGQLSGQVE